MFLFVGLFVLNDKFPRKGNEWILHVYPMLTEKKEGTKCPKPMLKEKKKKQRVGVFRFIGLALHSFCQTESLIIDMYF